MTQKEKILKYLREHETITPMEAFSELGITKLATRISEMKADGLTFSQELVKTKNRDGKPVCFMQYRKEEPCLTR